MARHATRRRFIGGLTTLVGTAGLAGCGAPTDESGGGDGSNGQRTTVELTDDLVFDPDQVSIAVGDTVVWENAGAVDHTVTAYEDRIPDGAAYYASGGFDAEQAARDAFPEGSIGGGETFEPTFETGGTYEYFCVPHEGAGMTGTVEIG